MRASSILVAMSGAATTLVLAGSAHAGNGIKLRTPVVWVDVPCMTVVDRSVDPVLHLPYSIPFEDPPEGESITVDEVADSRTHQFFTLAREQDQLGYLPRWIAWADIEAYAAKDVMFDPMAVDSETVFETSAAWEGAWFRITADDDRRPIEFDVAAMGVQWDTSALPPGTYHVEGYTHEPPFNLFTQRTGVVKVVDGPDPSATGPAVAFDRVVLTLFRNQQITLTGCVEAMAGTTVTAEWAAADPDLAQGWRPFAQDVAVTSPTFEVDFVAPPEVAGSAALLRITATDPMGRSYTNHLLDLVTVLLEDDPTACGDTGSFIEQGECAETGASAGSESAGGGAGSSSSGEPVDDPGGGCGCGTRPAWSSPLWLAVLAGLRRRARAHPNEVRPCR